jgi:hypothetical protein
MDTPGSTALGGGPARAAPSPLAAALLAATVGVAVAVAARDLVLVRPPLELSALGLWLVRGAGAAVALLGLRALRARRTQLRAEGMRRPDPGTIALRTSATLMGLITVIALLVRPALPPRTGGGMPLPSPIEMPFGLGGSRAGERPPQTRGSDPIIRSTPRDRVPPPPAPPVSSRDDSLRDAFWRMIRAIGPLLWIAAAIIAYLASRRRLRRWWSNPPPDGETPLDAEEAEEVLEASLTDVSGDHDDPRWQITSAYRRLLAALAEAGVPRRPEEAPYEHLRRALEPLGIGPEPLLRLAELYVVAHFSRRPLTDRHRREAAEALEASLADLRAARPARPPRFRGFRRAAAS